jgi:transketolase
MRGAFFRALMEAAAKDDRIYLLVGDLGFGVVEPFMQKYPERFLNVGVAEQNLTGVAAGIALTGKIVFTYSIANFPLLRCLEHVRIFGAASLPRCTTSKSPPSTCAMTRAKTA